MQAELCLANIHGIKRLVAFGVANGGGRQYRRRRPNEDSRPDVFLGSGGVLFVALLFATAAVIGGPVAGNRFATATPSTIIWSTVGVSGSPADSGSPCGRSALSAGR